MFDWITGFMETGGYGALFVLMLIENLFPPIPSEVIVPLAGFTAARGDLSFGMVIAVATLGSVVGAAFWYFIGRAFGFHLPWPGIGTVVPKGDQYAWVPERFSWGS